MRVVRILLSLSVFACLSLSAQQITGNIRGTVTDPTGAVVQGAAATALQAETGLSRTATTDRNGNYVLLELPVGHYRLQIAAKGFQEYVQDGIALNVNETASVSSHLAVGSENLQVLVSADAEMIEPTVTSMGKVVQQRELEDLPLNGRNFSQLGLLQPGVVPLTPGIAEAGGSLRNGQAYAVNGQRPESNNFLIDGANNFNGIDGGFVLKPPVDAISEFRIITHSANAEFGGALGSTTNIITRSGTNRFHGTLWEFLRNDDLDANNYFAQSKEPLKQNQFGAAAGGPIKTDRTFVFGFYEGFRNHQGETTLTTVPSLKQRTGDFSELCTEGFSGGFCNNPAHQLFNVFANAPYPNNQVPPEQFNSVSENLLSFFPLPNAGTNLLSTTQTLTNDTDQFGIKVDHYLSSRDTLSFRYMFNQLSQVDPLSPGGASVPGFPVGEDQRAQNFVADETHTFSPAVIGVARISFLRNKFLFGEHENHQPASSLGFQYTPSLAIAAGPPFVQVNGYTSVGDPITGPRNTFEDVFDYSASLTWVHGKHELKFGGGYQHQGINVLQGIATNGFFVFAPFPVTDAFASFLTGQPVVFLQGIGDFSRGIRGNNANWYAEDTFKVTSRFTINAGLRYELPEPYTEIHNRMSLFEPGKKSQVLPNAPVGLLYPGDPGVPAGLISTDKKAVSPRLGIAWNPDGQGSSLITAAYGIFYEPYYTGQGGPLQSPISAPPYLGTPQVSLPDFANPFNGNPPAPGTFSTPLTNLTLAPSLVLPYTQDWDLNLQHSWGSNWLLEIGYVGTKGTHLPRFIEANPAAFVPGYVDGQPISNSSNADQRRLYSGCTLADSPGSCQFSSTGEIASIANSSYHAFEASLHKRFSHGLSFLASYTWSKTIDDVSSFNITGSASKPVAGENDLAQNPFNLAAERGLSLFDARNRFVGSYDWALPFWNQGQTWYQKTFGGWQLDGIATMMSGTPFTVFDSNDVAAEGTAPEITGFSSQRPNLVGNPNHGLRTVSSWLNTSAYQRLDQTANAGQFGTEGRNVNIGPAFADWDFAALKNFKVTESMHIQFRAEMFDFLNRTNFRLPDSDISSPTFNHILTAEAPRQVQFALKFMY
ncbi:MAG TPA: carboxypeptidase regulatory-like domain-containing protein [Terriglobales bacterium]|nr:carboxypeptidase regulatory-like domain-containing protein [Terriglobales bacterium]